MGEVEGQPGALIPEKRELWPAEEEEEEEAEEEEDEEEEDASLPGVLEPDEEFSSPPEQQPGTWVYYLYYLYTTSRLDYQIPLLYTLQISYMWFYICTDGY